VDSFSGAAGSFGGGYVAGTPTTGPVSWTSASQSGSGSVTFAKTVYVTKGTVETSGRLSDTATVTGSDGFTATAGAKVDISVNTLAAMTIAKSIPDVLQGGETATFTFRVKDSLNQTVATVPLTFAAGETSKAADATLANNLATTLDKYNNDTLC